MYVYNYTSVWENQLWVPNWAESQEAHTDEDMLVVTTPAYMCQAPLHEVFDGIGEMIQSVVDLIDGK